ncbi:MAG: AAA family ATPase [bacterium]
MLEDYSKYLWVLLIVGAVIFVWLKKKGGVNALKRFKPGKSNTPYLSMYAVDLTLLASQGKIDPVVGRGEEVRKLSQVLSRRNKNNAILLGEPGVGKTAIAEALAQRIVADDVPTVLKDRRVLALNVSSMMAGTKYRGEFEGRAKKIVNEIKNSGRTIILFIDEVHAVVQSHGTEGAVNFADILKPALARGELQMIGATTFAEYDKYIKTDLSLERRFQPIEVKEPNKEDALYILQGVKDRYREYHKVEFTDAALKKAVDLSEKLIKNRKLPDKALDAIDEAAAMVRVSHIHEHIPGVLYQAAVAKDPKIAEIWKRIQVLDAEISKTSNKIKIKERDSLENEIALKGLVVVDEDDVEKVVRDWIK